MAETILTTTEAINQLSSKLSSVKIPDGLQDKVNQLFAQLSVNSHDESIFWKNYQNISKYIDWITQIPWFNESNDILDLTNASAKLNEQHYGLDSVKERLLEYISVL